MNSVMPGGISGLFLYLGKFAKFGAFSYLSLICWVDWGRGHLLQREEMEVLDPAGEDEEARIPTRGKQVPGAEINRLSS